MKITIDVLIEELDRMEGTMLSVPGNLATVKEAKLWRDWFKTLQKKKELIQYGLGRIASENPGLYSDLQHVSDALDKACAYPIPEKDADLYLE